MVLGAGFQGASLRYRLSQGINTGKEIYKRKKKSYKESKGGRLRTGETHGLILKKSRFPQAGRLTAGY